MAEAQESTAPVAANPKKQTVSQWSTTKLLRALRAANMCNGLGLIATGILVFFIQSIGISFSTVIVAGFVAFFGVLMTCLECNIGNLTPKLRRNFGFVFSFTGRAIFIMFCGTLLLATGNNLAYAVGAVTFVNAFFNAYVICVHPSFRTGELSASGDPFGGYTGGEAEMLAYIKSNPQLATKAGGAAIKLAQANPELAMQVAQGVHTGSATAPLAGQAASPWQ